MIIAIPNADVVANWAGSWDYCVVSPVWWTFNIGVHDSRFRQISLRDAYGVVPAAVP
jgi:hypothetical protein